MFLQDINFIDRFLFILFIFCQVKSAVIIDYEKKNKYGLLLEVTDSGTPPKTLEKTVTINVQNVNEAPTSVSISGNQVILFSSPAKSLCSWFLM